MILYRTEPRGCGGVTRWVSETDLLSLAVSSSLYSRLLVSSCSAVAASARYFSAVRLRLLAFCITLHDPTTEHEKDSRQ